MEQTENTYISALEDIKNSTDRNFDSLNVFAVQLSYIPWVNKFMNMGGSSLSYDRVSVIDILNSMQELTIYNSTYEFVSDIAILFNNKDTILSTRGKENINQFFTDIFRYKNIDVSEWNRLLSQYNNRFLILPQNVSVSNQPRRILTYIQSLPPGDKSFKATLILFIDIEKLNSSMEKASILQNGSLYVLDENNNFITGFNVDDKIKSFVSTQKYKNIKGGLGNNFKFSDNERYAIFYCTSDSNGWKYVAAIPIGAVMSKINYIRIVTVLLSLAYLMIGFGVSYYVTMRNYKPLDRIIELIRSRLSHERVVENEFMFLENAIYSMFANVNRNMSEIHLYKPLARNTCLVKLLKDGIDSDGSLLKIMDMLEITFYYDYFMAVSLLLAEDGFFSETDYKNISSEIASHNSLVYFAEIDARNKAVIFNMEKPESARTLVYILSKYLIDASFIYRAIGVGKVYDDINSLHKSYEEAVVGIDYRFVNGERSTVFFDDINDKDDMVDNIPEEEISNFIKSCNVGSALELARETIYQSMRNRQLSLGTIRFMCYSLAAIALKALEDMNIEEKVSISLKEILITDNIEEMMETIEELYKSVSALISREKESHNSQLIQEVIEYINNNYADHNLSLTQIAEIFGVSASYLSRFIKNQIGYNFVDFLNKKRIEAAKSLLLSDRTILEVAREVGFDNDITFRRLFKKYTGLTPSKFRGINLEESN